MPFFKIDVFCFLGLFLSSTMASVNDVECSGMQAWSAEGKVTRASLRTAYPNYQLCSSLALNNKGITSIESGAFSGMSNLERLQLFGNELTSLETGTFTGLEKLTILQLYRNKLTALETGTFSGLGQLDELQLYDNELTSMATGTFTGLASLTSLVLYGNKLTSLETGTFTGLGSLNKLELNHNDITSVESGAFTGLERLTWLSLWSNKITSLGNGAFTGLERLNRLQLYRNELTSLEAGTFTGLPALTWLDLNENELTSMETGTFAGLNLINLYLDVNEFKSLESGIFAGLVHLEYLDLSNNIYLTELLRGIFDDLSSMKRLTIDAKAECTSNCVEFKFQNGAILTSAEAFSSTCGLLASSGSAFANCPADYEYDAARASRTNPSASKCCKASAVAFSPTCGQETSGGSAFANCGTDKVYDAAKATTANPSVDNCCKASAVAFSATCGQETSGGSAFANCGTDRVYDADKASTTNPSAEKCCKASAATVADTDCTWTWDACEANCLRPLVIATPQSGGGKACPATDGAAATCLNNEGDCVVTATVESVTAAATALSGTTFADFAVVENSAVVTVTETAVSVALTLEGELADLSDADKAAFKTALAEKLNVPVAWVKLSFVAGSIVVTATVKKPDTDVADSPIVADSDSDANSQVSDASHANLALVFVMVVMTSLQLVCY